MKTNHILITLTLMVLVAISCVSMAIYACVTTKDYRLEERKWAALYTEAMQANEYKYQLLQQYEKYQEAADSLIERCYRHDDIFFLDVLMEGDEYWEYTEAQDSIETLILQEL